MFTPMAIAIRTSLADVPLAPGFTPNRPARPEKSEGGRRFVLKSDYEPAGDQPAAIAELVRQAEAGEREAGQRAEADHRGTDAHNRNPTRQSTPVTTYIPMD